MSTDGGAGGDPGTWPPAPPEPPIAKPGMVTAKEPLGLNVSTRLVLFSPLPTPLVGYVAICVPPNVTMPAAANCARSFSSGSRVIDDFADAEFDNEPAPRPMIMEEVVPAPAPAPALSHSEVISVDTMRNAMIANFEQEDLDVPAFLRKRNEAM